MNLLNPNHILNKEEINTSDLADINKEQRRDLNSYAEKHLSEINEINLLINKKMAELALAVNQKMNKPEASNESYTRLMAIIKEEIAMLEFKRDNLHNKTK